MFEKLIGVTLATCCALACSSPAPDAPANHTAAVTTPRAPASPLPVPAAAPAPAAPAAPPPIAVVAAPVAPPGPPRKTVTGDGISIVETATGQVVLKTTSTWGEAIDTTYSDCSYYSAAIPVLKGQLLPARAKLLTRVCAAGAAKGKR